MKKYRMGVIGALALLSVAPLFVSAQTAQDLAAQIQTLLAQIAALQTQAGGANPYYPPQVPVAPTSSQGGFCPQLFRSLSLGARGNDVLQLQQFLARQGLLDGSSLTGYFGVLTQGAVQRLQSSYGVVSYGDPASTGWGVVGVRTRSMIGLNCSSVGSTPYPIQITTPQQCPIALPPVTVCSTGWQAQADQNGCTISYRCSIALPGYSSPNSLSCNAIALLCPAGTHDQVGSNCSHACVPNTTGGVVTSLLVSESPSSITPGQNVVVSWSSQNPPVGSKVRLEVYKATDTPTQSQANNDRGLASDSSQLTKSGSYTWATPDPGAAIIADAGYGGYSLLPGQYKIVAKLYTGGTCWGYCASNYDHTIYATAASSVFTVGGSSGSSGTTTLSVSLSSSSIAIARSTDVGTQGSTLTISWTSQNAPSGSVAGLWLVKTDGTNLGLIAGSQSSSGTYNWAVPGPQCDADGACTYVADSPTVYHAEAGTYHILAKLYTPSGAYLGGFPPQNPTYPSFSASATSSSFSIDAQ